MRITEAEEILEAAHTHNINLNEEGVKTRLYQAKLAFIREYKNNPRGFLERFVKILDGSTNEEIPFVFNQAQAQLDEVMKESRRAAVPKARQLGMTTQTNGMALHHGFFIKNANVVCMAVKTDNAKENLRRIRTMFKSMPQWVQKILLGEVTSDNTELWAFQSKITGTPNKLEVASASSEDATRGKTPTFLHWTETAFSDVAEAIFTSIYPALDRRKDSVIVLESTGNGNSGFYYEVCLGIKAGFDVVFLPWFLEGDRRLEGEPLTEVEKEVLADRMGVKVIPEYLDEGQLRWYAKTSETMGKAKCQQEYPINVEQVFQATSTSYFTQKTMNKMEARDPLYHLDYSDGFIVKKPQGGPCAIYEKPRSDYEYLMSFDPSDGVYDPSSIQVFNPDGLEVAHWHEKLQAEDAVLVALALAKHYGNAKILVETNNIGEYVVRAFRSQYYYQNLYQEDGKLGIRTGPQNKPVMLALLQEYINSDKMSFSNSLMLEEMKTFQADTLKAQKDRHDDTIMSAALAAWAFSRQPPKKKRIADEYRDYTQRIDGGGQNRRRFVL